MATFNPMYRATVYAPRSVDATEATVLTPPAGAPHSDPFKVATAQGITGFQPYLDLPRGRSGRIDLKERKTDTGELALRFLDAKTGSGNLERWITAFLPTLMKGCKVVVEESLDGGSSWANHFTGRLRNPELDGRLWYTAQLRDLSEDLKALTFVGKPHSSITYAHRAALLPVGNTGAYGTLGQEDWIPATVQTLATTSSGFYDSNTLKIDQGAVEWPNHMLVAGWPHLRKRTGANSSSGITPYGTILTNFDVRVRVKRLDTNAVGEFILFNAELKEGASGQWYFRNVRTLELKERGTGEKLTGDPDYMALIPEGTAVEFKVYTILPPTPYLPIVVDDVHLVTLIKDVVSGKFGYIQSDGSVLRSFAYNSATFTALEADASIGTFRGLIEESTPIREMLDTLCLHANLAWYVNADGEVDLVDLRPPNSLSGIPTLGNSDLATGDDVPAPHWIPDSGNAVTHITARMYRDAPIEDEDVADLKDVPPDIRPMRVESASEELIVLDVSNPDVSGELEIDAIGFRYFEGETQDGTGRSVALRRRLELLADTIRVPFAHGPMYARVPLRRTSNVTSLKPGGLRLVAIDELPDPENSVRGGTRLMRAAEVTENGPIIDVLFLDAGLGTLSTAPTLGTITADGKHGVAVPVTLNGDGDRVRVDVAAVAVGAARPADDAAAWRLAGYLEATGTLAVNELPSRRTIHVRVRAEPTADTTVQLPSAWAYGSADTASYTAPSGGSASEITASTAIIEWATTETDTERLSTEILITTGGSPASWSDDDVAYTLSVDAARKFIAGLDGPSATNTVGIRHRDQYGGDTAVHEVTVTTNATTATAPRPAGIDIIEA